MDAAQAPAGAGFGVFRLIAELAPYVFDIIIILRLTDLLGIARDKKQEGIAESAGRVSRFSRLLIENKVFHDDNDLFI